MMPRLALAGIPSNSAGTGDGVARAPAALRAVGLVASLRAIDPTLLDLGDLALPPPTPVRDSASGLIDPAGLEAAIDAAAAATAAALADDRFAVLVGGDCPILLGALEAASAVSSSGACGCLFVDGHEDAYPAEASLTGEAADMELGLALGWGTECLPDTLRARLPLLRADEVILLGPRDADEIAAFGVHSVRGKVEIHDVTAVRADPAGIAADAAGRLASRTGRWWLHVDLDVLSTAALAAVDYRQPGGLAWSDLDALVRAALAVSGCAGLTLTIYTPDLDPSVSGARAIVAFLGGVLAR
jgi:arginase